MIGFDSSIAALGALFSWNTYGTIVDVLASCGLLYLPLLILIARTTTEAAADDGFAGGVSVGRKLEVGLILQVVALTVAVLPYDRTPLRATVERYSQCDLLTPPTPQNIGGIPTPDMPLLWRGVVAISNGITAATIAGTPCTTQAFAFTSSLTTHGVVDPAVSDDYSAFVQECYIPARRDYLENRKDYKQARKKYGEVDAGWIGSNILLSTGIYKDRHGGDLVEGFRYDRNDSTRRDMSVPPELAPKGAAWPNCEERWLDSDNGLRAKLLDEFADDIAAAKRLNNGGASAKEIEDAVLRTRTTIELTEPDAAQEDYIKDENLLETGWRKLKTVYGAVTGWAATATQTYPAYLMTRDGAPIAQSLALLVFVAALPFIMILSALSWRIIVTLTVVYFSITFWGAIFELIDRALELYISTLYPGVVALTAGMLLDPEKSTRLATILNVAFMFTVTAPLLFSSFMGMIGARVSHGIGALSATGGGAMMRGAGQRIGGAVGSRAATAHAAVIRNAKTRMYMASPR